MILATTPPSTASPGWGRRGFDFALTLGMLHLAIAVALMPLLGGWVVLYAVFPPYLLHIIRDSASTAPLFATLACGTGLLPALALHRLHMTVRISLSRNAKAILIAVLALWIPILCGEGIRWALMHSTLSQADAQCGNARSLIASLRERYTYGIMERGEPHAWMIRSGSAWLWSYRTLRFEPAPDWRGVGRAPAHCFSPTRDR